MRPQPSGGPESAAPHAANEGNILHTRLAVGIFHALDQAQAEGSIPPADSNFTAHAILAALGPDMYQYQRNDRGLTQEQIVEGVRRLYT